MSAYINNGEYQRFIGISPEGTGHHLLQGGIKGQEVDYVRCDDTIDVAVHEIRKVEADGTVLYNPIPLDVKVTWS